MEHHLVPGTVPRCPGGSASKGPMSWEVRVLAPDLRILLQPLLPHQPLPCPTLSHLQGPLGEVGRAEQGRAGLSGRQQGVIIASSTGLETELSLAFLSASQALC